MSVVTREEIEGIMRSHGLPARDDFGYEIGDCDGAGEAVAALVEERCERRLNYAVNEECSCGGSEPGPRACPACMIWHKYRAQFEAEREGER